MDRAVVEQIQATARQLLAWGHDLQGASNGAERLTCFVGMRNQSRRSIAALSDFPRDDRRIVEYLEQLAEIERLATIIVDGFPDVSNPEQWAGGIGAATGTIALIANELEVDDQAE